jgi:hypothetical protein
MIARCGIWVALMVFLAAVGITGASATDKRVEIRPKPYHPGTMNSPSTQVAHSARKVKIRKHVTRPSSPSQAGESGALYR